MNTPELINKLVGHLQPVRPTRSLLSRVGGWWICASVWAVAVLLVLDFRSDLSVRLADRYFIIETLALLGFSALIGIETFRLSIPGDKGNPMLWISLVLFVVWIATFTTRFFKIPRPLNQSFLDFHYVCSLLILLGSLVPNILLVRSIARNYALKPAWAGFMAGLSSGAVGGVLMQFVCAHDQAPHIFLWHALPLVLIGAVTAGLTIFWLHFRQSKIDDPFASL